MGRLEVIVGPMFSGKTEELIRRLNRAQVAGKKVVLFKPAIDNRYSEEDVVSHSGHSMKAISVSGTWIIPDYIRANDADVIGVDEGQFFDNMLGIYLADFLHEDKIVIVSGLDKDFACEGFGVMPDFMLMSDRLDKLTAICNKCGSEDGSFTQRLVNGKPAALDGPTILVGGTESYEARCRQHYEIG